MSQEQVSETAEAVPEGKIKCFITGELRPETPEEKKRQTVARSLVQEYEYSAEDIEIEFPIKMGSSTKRADIVVFPGGEDHNQESVYMIVEVKEEETKPSNENNGVEQLKSYTAACMNVKFSMWVGSERLAFKVGGEDTWTQIPDIPKQGEDGLPRPTKDDLKPAVNLKQVFGRIHNFIYANQGLQKDKAFEELLKVIFVKVYDEQYSNDLKFYILPDEDIDQVRARIGRLFRDVKQKYGTIFEDKETIDLNDEVLRYTVSEMQRFTFVNTDTDVKGEAYEELVGPNLRGDRGEFFTPRNVCDMTSQMVFSLFEEEELLKPGGVKILDPASGTGGFLISAIQNMKERYDKRGLSENQIKKNIEDVADNSLHGIDFNPFLVKVAQMNMVMHGDGYSNIVQANSLKKPSDWSDKARDSISLEKFDAVITNPPFGTQAVVENPDILEQYGLSEYDHNSVRESLPPEQLFIERCLDFLKPGGVLGVVLPDSILSNPGLEWIREWLLDRVQVIASVDLPVETFEPHTGTQTSVLILRKKDPEKNYDDDYEIFMSTPDKVGHDRRGNPVFKKDEDGKIKVNEKGRPIPNDDLPEVTKAFQEWIKEKGMK
jgi:type I restriction enzyme M protein